MAYITYFVHEARIDGDLELSLYVSDDNGYTWEYYASYETYSEIEDDMHMLGLLDEMDANV